MALSATIALSIAGAAVSSVPKEQKVRATITVSNSSGTAIDLNQIVPRVDITGLTPAQEAPSVAVGKCQVDSNNPVPASGSAIYVFDFTPHVSSFSSTFSVGCTIYGNGEVVSPTAATLTVV